MENMTVNEEYKMELRAARLEALYASQEHAAGLTSYEYATAACNVWDAALDRWAERMGV